MLECKPKTMISKQKVLFILTDDKLKRGPTLTLPILNKQKLFVLSVQGQTYGAPILSEQKMFLFIVSKDKLKGALQSHCLWTIINQILILHPSRSFYMSSVDE